MVEIINCPVCNEVNWQPVFTVADHSISKESFSIKKCSTCSLVVTSPRPDDNKLGAYYESENYISHSGKSNSIINLIYLQARKFSLNWKRKLISQLKPTGKILDIGCGTGEFLKTMQAAEWNIAGVEPNKTAREKAESILGIKLRDSITNMPENQDVITLWHVLEHLPDLNLSLEQIGKSLTGGGNLLIAVPNHTAQDANHYKENWAAYDVPRHLWHFNQKSMALLLQKHGFRLEKIIPMKLDAFYVSMLSEKYIRGNSSLTGIIAGFYRGLVSNLKAGKAKEYSSLIYIASK